MHNHQHFYILYQALDHQGNNQVVVNQSGNESQINEYYPYGGPWGNASTNQGFQPFKYNGRSALCDASYLKKELDRVHGLDWYDYGARRYDPAYCLFTQISFYRFFNFHLHRHFCP